MSEIVKFEFAGYDIQTFMINGEGWLLANDVCKVLDYQDPGQAVNQHVNGHDRLKRRVMFGGKHRMMWIINESGFNSLVLGSHLPRAQEFKHWVTSQVLPSIRKTGGYIDPNASTEQLEGLKARVEQLAGDKQAAIMREAKERKKALAIERRAGRDREAKLLGQIEAQKARADARVAEALREAEAKRAAAAEERELRLLALLEGKQAPAEAAIEPERFQGWGRSSIKRFLQENGLSDLVDAKVIDTHLQQVYIAEGRAGIYGQCPMAGPGSPLYTYEELVQAYHAKYPNLRRLA